VAAAGALAVAVVLYLALPYRREPGHRSLLPLWIKLPIIAAVICLLIAAKQLLSGFMAVFPMLAVVTTYEARHSLWTVCRQLAAIMLALVPMMVTVRLAQGLLGLGGALLAGWCVFLALFAPLAWKMWFAPARGAPGSGAGGTGAPPARVKERNRPCRLWRG